MSTLIRFLQRIHVLLLFLALLGLSLWLYISTSYYQKARFGRWALQLYGRVDERFTNIGHYVRMREANIGLRQENIALKNELERMRNREQWASAPAPMRGDTLAYTYIPARVVNNTVNRQQNHITLNVGLREGVAPGMGVVSDDGAVGIIAVASAHFSVAISLLNTDMKISASHRRSRTFGSLRWPGLDYRRVRLSEIPLHVQLTVGDTVATSGHSAIFPRDVPIGTIVGYELDGGSAYRVDVLLFDDFRSLDYVYVVRSAEAAERRALEQPYFNEENSPNDD